MRVAGVGRLEHGVRRLLESLPQRFARRDFMFNHHDGWPSHLSIVRPQYVPGRWVGNRGGDRKMGQKDTTGTGTALGSDRTSERFDDTFRDRQTEPGRLAR